MLLVYDSSCQYSFDHLNNWMSEIERYATGSVAKVILGNKCDLVEKRVVDPMEGKAFADDHGCGFFSTSAKTGEGVQEAFLSCAREILREQGEDVAATSNNDYKTTTSTSKKYADEVDDSCSDEESFSEDDLEADIADLVSKDVKTKDTPKSGEKEDKKKKHKKTDVNVFRLDMTNLEQETELMTGDPVACKRCGVMLSMHSASTIITLKNSEFTKMRQEDLNGAKLIIAPPITEKYMHLIEEDNNDTDDDNEEEEAQCWRCEFCGGANMVNLDLEEEMPHANVVDYLVSAPKRDKEEGGSVEEDSNIIFCIDISGSMCVTQELPGKHNLKGSTWRDKEIRELGRDAGQQYLPGQQRNVTHVSRLQCVQAAIEAQIEKLAIEHPNKCVRYVLFVLLFYFI